MGNAKKERSMAYKKQLISHLADRMVAASVARMKQHSGGGSLVKIGNALYDSKNAGSTNGN